MKTQEINNFIIHEKEVYKIYIVLAEYDYDSKGLQPSQIPYWDTTSNIAGKFPVISEELQQPNERLAPPKKWFTIFSSCEMPYK